MVGISLIHAFFLMILSYFLLNWYFVHWDEGELLQFGPILKKLVFNIEEKPPAKELMFINVSNDNQLVDFFDGEIFGNEAITDRSKLATFLNMLSETNNHKAVFLDIRFDLPSEHDELLQEAIDKTEGLIVSNHLTEGVPNPMVINATYGISDYPVVGGSFFKFQYIYQDTIKTVPLLMDEMINNKSYRMGKYFLREGNKSYFNTFLSDLLVRPYDLFDREDKYWYADLGNLTALDSDYLREITNDRIIILGDFTKYDTHETLLGTMPGPLILVNAYYTLSRGLNRLNWYSLAYIFVCYFVISLIIFIPGDPLEFWLAKISGSSKIASALAGFFSYFLLLILMVLTTYLIFSFLLNILWLTFYLYLIDKLVTFTYKKTGIIKKGNPEQASL